MIKVSIKGSDATFILETEEDIHMLFKAAEEVGLLKPYGKSEFQNLYAKPKQRKRLGVNARPCIKCGRSCQSKISVCHVCQAESRVV